MRQRFCFIQNGFPQYFPLLERLFQRFHLNWSEPAYCHWQCQKLDHILTVSITDLVQSPIDVLGITLDQFAFRTAFWMVSKHIKRRPPQNPQRRKDLETSEGLGRPRAETRREPDSSGCGKGLDVSQEEGP